MNKNYEELKKKCEDLNREKQELKKDLKNIIKKNRLKELEEKEKELKEKFEKLEEQIKFWQNKIDNEAKNKGVSTGVLETILKGSNVVAYGGIALSVFGFFTGFFGGPVVGIPLLFTGVGISSTSRIFGAITQYFQINYSLN